MKIILVEADYGYDGCSDCGYSGEVNVRVVDSPLDAIASENFRQALRLAGWVNLKELKDKTDKMVLEKEFYLYTSNRVLRKIEIDDLKSYDINALAYNGGMILQK